MATLAVVGGDVTKLKFFKALDALVNLLTPTAVTTVAGTAGDGSAARPVPSLERSAMKIDIFPHIFPVPFFERMCKVAGKAENMVKRTSEIPVLTDLNERFRIMDGFPEYVQVPSLPAPPLTSARCRGRCS